MPPYVHQRERVAVEVEERPAAFKHFVMMAGPLPVHELLRPAEAAGGARVAGVDDPGGAGDRDDLLIPRAEGIGHADDRIAAQRFKPAAVFEDFTDHFGARLAFEERVGRGVAGDLVALIEIVHFVGVQAVAVTERRVVQMERALETVPVEDFDQAAVLADAVVVAHRQCLEFAFRIEKRDAHDSFDPSVLMPEFRSTA